MKRYFECYGPLEWLEPEEYYKDDWSYEASDENFDIVFSYSRQEWRYTIV